MLHAQFTISKQLEITVMHLNHMPVYKENVDIHSNFELLQL